VGMRGTNLLENLVKFTLIPEGEIFQNFNYRIKGDEKYVST
jgi:hypothetical protein